MKSFQCTAFAVGLNLFNFCNLQKAQQSSVSIQCALTIILFICALQTGHSQFQETGLAGWGGHFRHSQLDFP